jgi:hypothetical protein
MQTYFDPTRGGISLVVEYFSGQPPPPFFLLKKKILSLPVSCIQSHAGIADTGAWTPLACVNVY